MSPQQEFDLKYITTSEIELRYGISKFKLSRLRGVLPGEVRIANVFVYVRKEVVPVLELNRLDARTQRSSK